MSMSVEVAASLLGVEVNASKEEILTAFKSRSRLVHPDRVNSEGEKAKSTAEDLMKQLNMAKEVLLDNLDKPKFPTNNASSSTFNNAGNSTKPPAREEVHEEVELTVEEQIAQFRAERKEEIDKAKDVLKTVGIVLMVNLAVLLVAMGVTFVLIMMMFANWNVWALVWVVLGLGACVYMWRRTLVRFYAFGYAVQELNDLKKVSRLEERGYRKAMKPDNPDSVFNKIRRINDRF